jgi:biopolymer transport protein ExbB
VRTLLQIIRPVCLVLVLFVVSSAITSRSASAQGTAAPAPKVKTESLLDIYLKGGPTMHAIALASIGTIAIISFCVIRIKRKTMLPPTLASALGTALAKQDVVSALKLCEGDSSSLAHIVKETFTKAGAGVEVYSKSDLESVAAETIFHEETKYMLWVNMLNGLAAIAPMMGLLGTVAGMIGSFDQLAAGASKPSDFAGGIGEAMITTASALIVAIPAMMAYFVFKNLLQSLISQLAHTTSNLINGFVSGSPVGDPASEI